MCTGEKRSLVWESWGEEEDGGHHPPPTAPSTLAALHPIISSFRKVWGPSFQVLGARDVDPEQEMPVNA